MANPYTKSDGVNFILIACLLVSICVQQLAIPTRAMRTYLAGSRGLKLISAKFTRTLKIALDLFFLSDVIEFLQHLFRLLVETKRKSISCGVRLRGSIQRERTTLYSGRLARQTNWATFIRGSNRGTLFSFHYEVF